MPGSGCEPEALRVRVWRRSEWDFERVFRALVQLVQRPNVRGESFLQASRIDPSRWTHRAISRSCLWVMHIKDPGKGFRSWCDGSSDRSFMWWTHWAISRSSQCSTTGVSCLWVMHIKDPLLLIRKSSPCGSSRFSFSILHGVDPLSYFSFQPMLHDWCNKGCGMCYPVCGVMHIKYPLLLIRKSSPCGGSRFPFSMSEWSFTICMTPHNCK